MSVGKGYGKPSGDNARNSRCLAEKRAYPI